MAESLVISGLRAKRDDLARDIAHATAVLRQLTADLDTIENALRVMDPEAEPARLSLTARRQTAGRGEVVRLVLAALRAAPGPLSTREVALAVMAARGMDAADARLVRLMVRRVGMCLAGQRKRSTVVRDGLRWLVAD